MDVEPEVAFRDGPELPHTNPGAQRRQVSFLDQLEQRDKIADKMKTTTLRNLIILLGIFATALAADATIVTGPIQNPGNGHTYFLVSQNNWTASEAEAVTLGGHLATINDQAENDWVYSTFANYGSVDRNLWIGLTDKDVEATFKWISGEPVSFLNWGPQEPNNYGGLEDYVHMFSSHWTDKPGKWNDYQDLPDFYEGTKLFGVVEVVPEPATIIAGAFLLIPLGASVLRGLRKNRTA